MNTWDKRTEHGPLTVDGYVLKSVRYSDESFRIVWHVSLEDGEESALYWFRKGEFYESPPPFPRPKTDDPTEEIVKPVAYIAPAERSAVLKAIDEWSQTVVPILPNANG